MQFRPCIDIHNGKVKQIVGGSLKDSGNQAEENFVSAQDAAWYARKYQSDGITGGHIILLNPESSEYYAADVAQALSLIHIFQSLLSGFYSGFPQSWVYSRRRRIRRRYGRRAGKRRAGNHYY